LQDKPILRLPINNKAERGLLGIAVLHKNNNKTDVVDINVFLYFTESDNKSSSNIRNDRQLSNKIYKYEWNGQTLVNTTLILNLPAIPGPYHNGGKLIIGPDHYLYTVIGDLGGPKTEAQNNKTGPATDGTGGILRVTQDGDAVGNGIFWLRSACKSILYIWHTE
jgi:aldose sugar dehydrogenase